MQALVSARALLFIWISVIRKLCVSPYQLVMKWGRHLPIHGFSEWLKAGRLPGPIRGTTRWDRKAIDAAPRRCMK